MNEDDILQFNILVINETYYSDETTWGCFNFSTKDDIPYFVEPSKTFDPFKENHSDKNVKITDGKELKGDEAFPVFVAKGQVV